MSGFDPILVLNRHIALLKLLKAAEQEVGETKGVVLSVVKMTGRAILHKFEQSRATMKMNKMWVQDNPINEGRYQYSLFGRRELHSVSQYDIDLYVGMILREMERELESLK